MSIREEFVLKALEPNINLAALCRDFGVSRKTGYKWIERYESGGVLALRDLSRRDVVAVRAMPWHRRQEDPDHPMTSLLVTAFLMALGSPSGDVASVPSRVRTDPPLCLPTDITFPVDATGPMPEAITIRFEIGGDGAAKDISIGFPVGAPVSDLLVEAAKQAVEYCTWVPTGEGSTDPVSRKVALRLPVVPAPTDRRGLRSPKMVDPDCFSRAFNMGPLVPNQKLAITAKFPIFADGKPGRARLLNQSDDAAIQDRLERSITVAVKSCEWVPGKDGSGRPTLVYVVLPIRIQ